MESLTYTRVGDYELPDLKAPPSPEVGLFGRAYLRYLREHKHAVYSGMLYRGTLKAHVERIDRDAEELFESIVRAEAKARGVNESLKARDQMEWVRQMNAVRAAAREYVMREVLTL